MNYAFRNVRDNAGSDIFTLFVYAVINTTLICNIFSTVDAPAWAYVVFIVASIFFMIGLYFARLWLSENSNELYHLCDTIL
jgi:hypothetical protein